MDLTLQTPIQFVPQVGPARASLLQDRLGIFTVSDILYHIPHRYNDFSLVTPIGKAQPGETVTILGTIESMKTFVTKNGKRIIEGVVSDTTGKLNLLWFNQQYLLRVLYQGDEVSFSGTVNWFGRKVVLSNPQFEIISSKNQDGNTLHTGRIVPVYPETEGITSKWLRARIAFLLEHLNNTIDETLPDAIISTFDLMPLAESLKTIHFPQSLQEAQEARRRLAFEELLFFQLKAHIQKQEWIQSAKGVPLLFNKKYIHEFLKTLPFTLTTDQKQTIEQSMNDLTKPLPMNRLIIGDVGSGKTIVAATLMIASYHAGYSSTLLAPTQVLAQQHFKTISDLFSAHNIRVDLHTGDTKTLQNNDPSQQHLFEKKAKPSVVVGTHALLSDSIKVKNLGLVVVDEQHRFGVSQRSKLLTNHDGSHTPHLLTMTATPIPRSLAKTLFGHMEVSFLAEMPKGRQKVKTWFVPGKKRENAYAWIKKHIRETGGQVFIICPFVEESDEQSEVKAVTKEFKRLQPVFSEFSLGLLHGRLKPKEKTSVLERFSKNNINILVATPVVEVGIDIPNATIMMIEGASRFGLGQLHQLRGRVGRGEKQSYCLLFAHDEEETDEKSVTRLKAMETIHSGPELSEVDLKLRGAGDLFGLRQHGKTGLKFASLTDTALFEATKQAADMLFQVDPELKTTPHLRDMVKQDIIQDTVD